MKVSPNLDDSVEVSFSCRGDPPELPCAASVIGNSREAGEGRQLRFPRIPARCESCLVAPHVLTYCGFLFRVSKYLIKHLEAQAVQNVINYGL